MKKLRDHDVGVPRLPVHSPLKTMATLDVHMAHKAVSAFFTA